MKLTNTRSIKSAKGMTLLELTVVILVLLSLISILFVGARAWKKGADKAASVMVIRNTQQAVRSFANLHNVNPDEAPNTTQLGTDADLPHALFGTDKFMAQDPTNGVTAGFNHPAGNAFSYEYSTASTAGAKVPAIGKLYIDTVGDTNFDYTPSTTETTSW